MACAMRVCYFRLPHPSRETSCLTFPPTSQTLQRICSRATSLLATLHRLKRAAPCWLASSVLTRSSRRSCAWMRRVRSACKRGAVGPKVAVRAAEWRADFHQGPHPHQGPSDAARQLDRRREPAVGRRFASGRSPRAAGAVLLGKTSTPEFGCKAETNSPRSGLTRNPWNPARTLGGSSGGAAVAVGTDGAGSVRIPAAFCGTFGLKPSFGRVPAYPLSPMGTEASMNKLLWRVFKN